jgi:hypothetical protein
MRETREQKKLWEKAGNGDGEDLRQQAMFVMRLL